MNAPTPDGSPTNLATPITAQPACCPWRSAMQLPLLLVAAAGVGVAGQHAWNNRAEFESLLASAGVSTCAMSPSEGCGSALANAEGCSSPAVVESGCGSAAAVAVAVMETEEAVSALAPDNTSDSL